VLYIILSLILKFLLQNNIFLKIFFIGTNRTNYHHSILPLQPGRFLFGPKIKRPQVIPTTFIFKGFGVGG